MTWVRAVVIYAYVLSTVVFIGWLHRDGHHVDPQQRCISKYK